MNTDFIINRNLSNIRSEWDTGILKKTMDLQEKRAENLLEAIKIAGIGEKIDFYA